MDLYIMCRDRIGAEWKDNKFKIIDKSICPLYLLNTGNVWHWLEMRAVDYHRANSRLLKKALRLSERDDISCVISVNAVTITDSYWVKPVGSDLKYADVRFGDDFFSDLALNGNYDSFNKALASQKTRTPELTNIGSFEKCWKLIDGEWWMYKAADIKQQFSEIFISELGKKLGFNMALYIKGNKCVKTKDFTNSGQVNFEPAYSFMGEDEDYIETVKRLKILAPHTVGDYVRIIFMDTVTANPDRHTFNFGLLRNAEDGSIISLAPNFDNNMALISRGYPSNTERKKDVFIDLFTELMKYDRELIKYIPEIREETVREIIDNINMRVRRKDVLRFVMNGYRRIAERIKEL